MKFTKMHGLGNDFVMLECLEHRPDDAELPEMAVRWCDRHFGIGADGLILALPSERADFRMRIINSDGSEAAHCGNAIRCLAKLLYERGHTTETCITVETVGRVNTLRLEVRDGIVDAVCVDMGEPVFDRARIPMAGPGDREPVDEELEAEGQTFAFTCLSMGNPHAVTFVDDVDAFPVEQLGPVLERHPIFPDRCNIEFIQLLGPEELKMRVWERGAGITLACGTGACASLIAAARTGRSSRRAVVHLPGGDLRIEWRDDNHVYMTGPAVEVFQGETLE